MNKIIIIGRATTDIELKQTQSGTPVSTFSVAVSRRTRDEGTDFLNVVAWQKTAELVSRYVHKGDKIGVIGRVQARSFEGRDGKKVYVTEIIADEVEFLESKKTASEAAEVKTQEIEPTYEELGNDEDLPF